MTEKTKEKTAKFEKPPTPLQSIKKLPKAMQVGPQLQLRKGFCEERNKELKGGV